MRAGDVVRVPAETRQLSTRQWISAAHDDLKSLLPPTDHGALLTEGMTGPRGEPTDVIAYFNRENKARGTFFGNWNGLLHTAQTVGTATPLDYKPPPWPEFEPVWIPINDKLSVHGDLGLVRDAAGEPVATDCIVVLPGFLGDNSIRRTRDLCEALRAGGFHALALEPRGHGLTDVRYPGQYYSWGVLETGDLLRVSEWLEGRPEVRRTGLIGFCWSANSALLVSWYDAVGREDATVPRRLRAHLYPGERRPHFTAGVIAFSPVLNFEEIIDRVETPYTLLGNPPLAGIQDSVKNRMVRKGHPQPSGSLRTLIEFEIGRLDASYPEAVPDGLDFLRLLPYRDRTVHDKLEAARIPVLIVHGANDPLTYAQEIATLMSSVENPAVAAIILPGGGHIGFAAYCRAYYYSLVLNYFDAQRGAGAAASGAPLQPPTGPSEHSAANPPQ